jgi:uncharacterized protein DUF2188
VAERKNPAVETLPHPEGGWGNKVQGNDRFSNRAEKKADAQKTGRDMAQRQQTEHIIKKQDGKIGERNSYGNDPHPPKG